MIGSHSVVVVCPAGRRRYLELLVKYVLRERGVVDRFDLWLNTLDAADAAHIAALERQHPDFIRVVRVPSAGTTPRGKQFLGTSFQIGAFYPHAAEADTVYVRVDDDIVYVSPHGIRALATERIANPAPFLVYPTIINNAIMTHFLQEDRVFGREKGTAPYELVGAGLNNPRLAEHLHRKFIATVKRGEGESFRVRPRTVSDYKTVSVNCISWLGSDMAACASNVGQFEEQYLAAERPKELGRPNFITSAATFAHFSYGEQRDYLDRTNLLEEYRRIS